MINHQQKKHFFSIMTSDYTIVETMKSQDIPVSYCSHWFFKPTDNEPTDGASFPVTVFGKIMDVHTLPLCLNATQATQCCAF